MESEHSWYYLHRAHQVGPYSLAELYMLLAKEVIAPTTLVWSPGRGGWREFQDVSGQPRKPPPKPRGRWMAAVFGMTMFFVGLTAVEGGPVESEPVYFIAAPIAKSQQQALERIRLYRPNKPFIDAVNTSPSPRFAAAARGLLPEERLELQLWRSVALSHRLEGYRSYLREYPAGAFAAIADVNIRKLRKPAASKSRKKPAKTNGIGSPATADSKATALKVAPSKPAGLCTHRNRDQCRQRCSAGETQACQKLQRLGG
jgi:hypothetical protein